ncbi:hypothetical protein BRYFOR_09549 [Marvinbryantia formatexigens DSM 14469]|uniref:Uncharacterized protein n=1 Tax=Marvinbryantia formatexigens DSM 14469 TaxID=478749 RepID=C6LLK1_9FIRM|nr:hypothetical protein BRYFOR_09549 [Marvinbryantia formatexigens DSM 14469]
MDIRSARTGAKRRCGSAKYVAKQKISCKLFEKCDDTRKSHSENV